MAKAGRHGDPVLRPPPGAPEAGGFARHVATRRGWHRRRETPGRDRNVPRRRAPARRPLLARRQGPDSPRPARPAETLMAAAFQPSRGVAPGDRKTRRWPGRGPGSGQEPGLRVSGQGGSIGRGWELGPAAPARLPPPSPAPPQAGDRARARHPEPHPNGAHSAQTANRLRPPQLPVGGGFTERWLRRALSFARA